MCSGSMAKMVVGTPMLIVERGAAHIRSQQHRVRLMVLAVYNFTTIIFRFSKFSEISRSSRSLPPNCSNWFYHYVFVYFILYAAVCWALLYAFTIITWCWCWCAHTSFHLITSRRRSNSLSENKWLTNVFVYPHTRTQCVNTHQNEERGNSFRLLFVSIRPFA